MLFLQKKKKKTKVTTEKKPARVALLDMKRCQNVGIALAQFKCSHADIRSAILSMDPSVLDLDRLQACLLR
jgi:hypothetical protein